MNSEIENRNKLLIEFRLNRFHVNQLNEEMIDMRNKLLDANINLGNNKQTTLDTIKQLFNKSEQLEVELNKLKSEFMSMKQRGMKSDVI